MDMKNIKEMVKLKHKATDIVYTLYEYALYRIKEVNEGKSKYCNLHAHDMEGVFKDTEFEQYVVLDECGNYEFLDTDVWEVIIEKAKK